MTQALDTIKAIFTKLKLEKRDEEDSDQNFIKKDEDNIENVEDQQSNIKPKNNQTRTLDKEVGGLEEEQKKEISSEDIWDDRSEEVDEMGSTNVFNGSGMKSVVWKQKRNRLKQEKLEEMIEAHEQSHVQRLENNKNNNNYKGR